MTTLYYLKLTDLKGNTHYKVGVTEGTVSFRYNGETETQSWKTPLWQFEVLFVVQVEDGFTLEGLAKDRFRKYRSFKKVSQSKEAFGHRNFGSSEVFSKDVLNFTEHKRVDVVLSSLRRTESLALQKEEAKKVTGFKGFVLNLALATALAVS